MLLTVHDHSGEPSLSSSYNHNHCTKTEIPSLSSLYGDRTNKATGANR